MPTQMLPCSYSQAFSQDPRKYFYSKISFNHELLHLMLQTFANPQLRLPTPDSAVFFSLSFGARDNRLQKKMP
jgi:hypothetical protein